MRCILALVDPTPWATLDILLGRDVKFMKKTHSDIHMNVPCRHAPKYHDNVSALEG